MERIRADVDAASDFLVCNKQFNDIALYHLRLALSGNQGQILLSSLGELATTTVNAMLYTYPFSNFSTSPIFSRLRRTERMIEPLAYKL